MSKTSDTKLRRALRAAANAAADKKALDLVLLDLRQQADFCDYFLICHGTNPHQMEAIADAVEERLEQEGFRPAQREGKRQGEWLALDYVDFMVHIFSPRTRRFYDLERLWSGAPHVSLTPRPRHGQA
ncbi:MAG: ribosome silencing factor [Acidobacteria bacterium]|nr:MAG: ribosome silencing factor [Acidobacteriota bacterium]